MSVLSVAVLVEERRLERFGVEAELEDVADLDRRLERQRPPHIGQAIALPCLRGYRRTRVVVAARLDA